VVGGADDDVRDRIRLLDLTERFGLEVAMADTPARVTQLVTEWLASR
ncbi:MAG: hypothetical protein GWN79_03700, partial [Actinobacteria bacterium]|nr:hypothetical protein [Actinomycetota bacterium]NIT94634.1 hypothetical protein [Actinomycetota bacterium]NIU18242.1 hypothetical protein [Actinomycetota bacterium]NIV54736.1 hypothetical protein [Actinomycetota bacterium]NIX49619.1 hypothetical protein [Actinomycetota bacterium]